jgi:predicted SAM-dependent methyltransferase
MKINMGSNNVPKPGFLNLDIRDIPEVDIVDDFTTLEKVEDNSVEEMLCHNIFHIMAVDETEKVLKLWVRKLVDGGTIEIGVPDGELLIYRYLKDRNWEGLVHGIFGGIQFLRQWHGDKAMLYIAHNLFCEQSLRELMEKVGLKEIRRTKKNHPDNITLRAKKYGTNQS